jgi:hypothetical protein
MLEAAWVVAWRDFGMLRGHGLLKSRVFVSAFWLSEKPCFLLNLEQVE